MIIALMGPVLQRLAAEKPRADRLARYLTETFVTDIDDSLREMGVGDMSVPKKVKRAAQALGERGLAYRSAAQSADPRTAVAAELAVSVPGLAGDEPRARALADRVLAFQRHVDGLPLAALVAGVSAYMPQKTPSAAAAETRRPA